MFKVKSILFLIISMVVVSAYADTRVNVVGLFNNKALIIVNGGSPESIRAGQTKNGVKLISANSNAATFVIEGKRQVLKMGQAAFIGGGSGSASGGGANNLVHLFADSRGHFYGKLNINGASLKYLVDTGATGVSMNSGDAKYAKIDYEKGKKAYSNTANGRVPVYIVTLNTLKIGTIVLNNVKAIVHEGGSPSNVLLGMSALNRLNMSRNNSTLTLTKKY